MDEIVWLSRWFDCFTQHKPTCRWLQFVLQFWLSNSAISNAGPYRQGRMLKQQLDQVGFLGVYFGEQSQLNKSGKDPTPIQPPHLGTSAAVCVKGTKMDSSVATTSQSLHLTFCQKFQFYRAVPDPSSPSNIGNSVCCTATWFDGNQPAAPLHSPCHQPLSCC